MSVAEILRTVRGSCDFGDVVPDEGESMDDARTRFWMHVIEDKSSDSGFDDLIRSILTHGFIEDSAVGWYDNEITEGHHRIVAAILLGMDEVPVSDWGTNSRTPSGEWISAHHTEIEKHPYLV